MFGKWCLKISRFLRVTLLVTEPEIRIKMLSLFLKVKLSPSVDSM